MKILQAKCPLRTLLIAVVLFAFLPGKAQTDLDALMMKKNRLCAGFMYVHNSWDEYWEGTFKRDNLNLGTVTTQMIGVMGAYGITNKVNLIFSLPYVKTKASAGTFSGLDGIQDLSLFGKWQAAKWKAGKGNITLFGVAGISFPVSNYTADYLPFSIGLESKTLSLRVIGDYDIGRFFVTGSGTCTFRDNITIDRDAYYTTQMHYTNEVYMPDVMLFNLRAGYRHSGLIAELFATSQKTLGGFDITKNNMPFPSNEMNMTMVGAGFKYDMPFHKPLSVIGGAGYVVKGRNVGQSLVLNGGVFYVFDFSRKTKSAESKK